MGAAVARAGRGSAGTRAARRIRTAVGKDTRTRLLADSRASVADGASMMSKAAALPARLAPCSSSVGPECLEPAKNNNKLYS